MKEIYASSLNHNYAILRMELTISPPCVSIKIDRPNRRPIGQIFSELQTQNLRWIKPLIIFRFRFLKNLIDN